MTVHVPVLIEQDEDGVFIVSVPTLRGCHSYGYTMEEAMANIAEAVQLCLQDEPLKETPRFVGVRDLEIAVCRPSQSYRRACFFANFLTRLSTSHQLFQPVSVAPIKATCPQWIASQPKSRYVAAK